MVTSEDIRGKERSDWEICRKSQEGEKLCKLWIISGHGGEADPAGKNWTVLSNASLMTASDWDCVYVPHACKLHLLLNHTSPPHFHSLASITMPQFSHSTVPPFKNESLWLCKKPNKKQLKQMSNKQKKTDAHLNVASRINEKDMRVPVDR